MINNEVCFAMINDKLRTFFIIHNDFNFEVKAKSEQEAAEIANMHMEYYSEEGNYIQDTVSSDDVVN